MIRLALARRRTTGATLAALVLMPAVVSGQTLTSSQPPTQTRPAQDAAQPNTLFPQWRLQAVYPIDPRVAPNAGIRLRPLFPTFSPVAPDFLDPGGPSTPWSLRASVAVFGVDDERASSKFQEFRDLRDGVTAGLEARYREGDYLFNVVGRQLGRDDQDLAIDGGKGGQYYFTALYDETPHNYAFGVPSLYGGIGTGRLTIADPIQADLQSISAPVALAARTQTYVDSAHRVDLSLSRQKAGGEFTLAQTYPFILKASFTNESRDGVRPWSASVGFANIQDIPWPVSYDTRELRISAERAMPESRVIVNAGYRLSWFENHIDSLTFDNPFRVADSSAGAIVMTSGAGPATGRIALYPSNEYHEGSVSTVVRNLPARGVLSAFFSAGFMRQNEPLIPFSTNSDAILPTVDGRLFRATDPSGLPRATAETSMDTQTAHVRWTSQPAKKLRLAGQYRLYALQNDAAPFVFPAFVREDADPRPTEGTPGGTFRSVPADYHRHTGSVDGTYSLTPDTRLGASYTFERMNRSLREVARMNDHRVKISLDQRAASWLDLRTSYTYTDRSTSTYDFAQYQRVQGLDDRPMMPFLRKFDEAPLHRQDAQVMATVTRGNISVSGQGVYGNTDYHDSPFGLLSDRHGLASVDASYALAERVSVFADYSYERFTNQLRARHWIPRCGEGVFPPCAPGGPGDPYRTDTGFESANNWENRSRDNIHSAGVGLDAYVIPRRLRVQLQYTFSRTDGRWAFESPIGGATDLNPFDPAPAEQVDDVRWHVLNPELEVKLTERLALTAAYSYEKWDVSDFNYEGFSNVPVLGGLPAVAVLTGAILPPAYDNHVLYMRLKVGF